LFDGKPQATFGKDAVGLPLNDEIDNPLRTRG